MNRTEKLCLLLVPVVFTLLPLLRLYPFDNPAKVLADGPDDWNYYAKFALEIKNGGLLIPSFREQYQYPGGFLYNYFVAACLKIFGDDLSPVYVLQSILLGMSVVLVLLTFRNRLKPFTWNMLLVALVLFGLLDVSKYYSVRLLSENLALFTLAAFIYCLIKGIKENILSFQLSAVFFLVISLLTRPNLFSFGMVFVMLMLLFNKYFGIAGRRAVAFSLIVVAGMSLIAVRNYLVCGKLIFMPSLGVSDALTQVQHLDIGLILKKALFMLGFQPVLSPEYQFRPHWMLMWTGYFIYLFIKRDDLKKLRLPAREIFVHLFILTYCASTIIFVTVDSYGFRSFIPVNFLILPFSFMAIDHVATFKSRQKNLQTKSAD